MSVPRIYVDLHNLDDDNRVRLTCAGTLKDLEQEGIALHEGLPLSFYTDDADDQGHPDPLYVDGVVEFDATARSWVARMDWPRLRHASQDGTVT